MRMILACALAAPLAACTTVNAWESFSAIAPARPPVAVEHVQIVTPEQVAQHPERTFQAHGTAQVQAVRWLWPGGPGKEIDSFAAMPTELRAMGASQGCDAMMVQSVSNAYRGAGLLMTALCIVYTDAPAAVTDAR